MKKNAGQTLVATMVVLVIICILAGVYFVGTGNSTKSARPDGKGQTLVGQAIYKARDEVCRSNINQVRQSLQIAWTTDEAYPATIQETRLGEDFYKCPLGKEPYDYDPQTGQVRCKHPGHEKF